MQNANHAKTELVHSLVRNKRFVFLVTVGLLVLAVIWLRLPDSTNQSKISCTETYRTDDVIHIGDSSFSAEIANDDQSRAKGLSGRSCLPENKAMLFIFPEESSENRCFWMKDMKFDIDILWLDAQKKIVYLENNVSFKSYPRLYCPDKPSQYVVELAAGGADKQRLTFGSMLNF